MDRFVKVVMMCVTLLTLCGSASYSHAQQVQSGSNYNVVQDDKLRQLVYEIWNWRLRQFPELALGFTDEYDDRLESFDEQSVEQRYVELVNIRRKADIFKGSRLSVQDNLTLSVLLDQIDTFITGYQWKDYGWLTPINHMEGFQLRWIRQNSYETERDFEYYLKRMNAFPKQVDEAIKLMEKAISLNRTNHAVSMRGVVTELMKMSNCSVKLSAFYSPYSAQSLDIVNLTSDTKKEIRNAGVSVIKSQVQPALERLAVFIDQKYMPATRKSYGVGSLHNGTEYYKALLRWYLSVDITPEEVHELGFRELRRIQGQLNDVAARLGHSGDLPSIFLELRNLTKYFNHSEEQYLNLFKTAINDRIIPRLPKLFSGIEQIPKLRVVQTPSDGIAAMYTFDTLLANNRNPHTRPAFDVLTLSLHEGLPGHHLQMSTAFHLNLPDFRRFLAVTRKSSAPFSLPYYASYIEGWGLYAEFLGEELDLFKADEYELFSRYSYEIFRACRLIVDTGIHAFGWTRDRAIEFVAKYTFQTRSQIEIEIDRYITFPGQACSYKIGELKLKELRNRAASILGSKFDVRSFHSAVLNAGPLSLATLDALIDEWTREQLAMTSSTSSLHSFPVVLLVQVVVICNKLV